MPIARTAHTVAALAILLAIGAAGSAAQQAKREAFIGTWLSEAGGATNVTTLHGDGRFNTVFLMGVDRVGSVGGRWSIRGDAFVWVYDQKPGSAGEDVNPIDAVAPHQFTLRELNGELSTFYRMGVPDPAGFDLLPVAIGTGWVLEDEAGRVTIRVAAREQFGGRDCYRVDWIEGPLTYQSEYWNVGSDGVYAVGRRALGKALPFAQPYLLLKRGAAPGDSWKAAVSAPGFEDALVISVGSKERVVTPAGAFEAVPVSVQGRALRYRRWYAPGIGLVQEEAARAGGEVMNVKRLRERLN